MRGRIARWRSWSSTNAPQWWWRPRWTAGSSARRSIVIAPGPRSTRYGAAITAAADVLAGRGGRLVVVSDLQQNGWVDASAAALPAGTEVEALDVGAPRGNLAVVSLRRQDAGMTATLRNGGTEPKPARVALTIEGRARAERQVTIPAGASQEVHFALPLPAAGAVRAEVTDPEGYAADNVRFAVLDTPPRPRIVAITTRGPRAVTASMWSGRLPRQRGRTACASNG